MKYQLINKDSTFQVAILADGDFPHNDIPLNILNNTIKIIVCDGAARKFNLFNITDKQITLIGDGDSCPDNLKKKFSLIHISEQQDNDLTKATKYALSKESNITDVAYIAATGKREDHTLANIFLLMHYYDKLHLHPVMISDYGYFIPTDGDSEFQTFPGQQVSIYNFDCKILEGKGLRWDTYPYKEFWQGTLNEATGTLVSFHADGNYLVYLTHKRK